MYSSLHNLIRLTRKFVMSFCSYYQAQITRSECWFVTAILRSADHLSFDRTLNTAESIFEFFVPEAREQEFLRLMKYFQEINLVHNLQKLPNRLMTEEL